MTDSSNTLRLSEFLPYRLSVLTNTMSRGLAKSYETEFGITVWQWRIMAVLGESGAMTATDITLRTAMDKVAVSRAVNGLIEDGRLAKETMQEDGRRALLSLTEEGRSVYHRIVPMALEYEKKMSECMTPEELDQFEGLLVKIAGVVSPDRDLW